MSLAAIPTNDLMEIQALHVVDHDLRVFDRIYDRIRLTVCA